jgi:hypothetical protein
MNHMFDDNKHKVGYLQVWSHIRRKDKRTGKWVNIPNPAITRVFENKKYVGWVSIRDPELTKLIGESPATLVDKDFWEDEI